MTGGVADVLRRSWASSYFRQPLRGPEWELLAPGTSDWFGVPALATLDASTVELLDAPPYAVDLLRVTSAGDYVLADVTGGHVRIADAAGRDIEIQERTWLCTRPPCQCPGSGTPPGVEIEVLPPFDVAVTGWTEGASGWLAGQSSQERCEEGQQLPGAFCERLEPLRDLLPVLLEAYRYGPPGRARGALARIPVHC